MEPRALAKRITGILDGKKAEDLRILEITELSTLADFFIIATGSSATHLRTLHEEVGFQLKNDGVMALHKEGQTSGNWLLLDYGSVVVHLFMRETREFYSIERLWSDAKNWREEEL